MSENGVLYHNSDNPKYRDRDGRTVEGVIFVTLAAVPVPLSINSRGESYVMRLVMVPDMSYIFRVSASTEFHIDLDELPGVDETIIIAAENDRAAAIETAVDQFRHWQREIVKRQAAIYQEKIKNGAFESDDDIPF